MLTSQPVTESDEVILWKAPQTGRPAAQEVVMGYAPETYPGNGPYFAAYEEIAEEFRRAYENGMQKIHLPRGLFVELLAQGVIKADALYSEGQAYHVPAAGLGLFNEAIKQGTPNQYIAQRGEPSLE
jgi:hypothetical protein